MTRNQHCDVVHTDSSETKQRPIKQSFCVSLRRDAHWKCLILTLLICGCLTAICWCRIAVITTVVVYYDRYMSQREVNKSSPCADGYIYIPVAFVILLYLVYLVECWHCHTRIELKHKVDVQTVYHKIRQMREAFPIVWWKAMCYHYVRRTRQVTRYRNGDAFTTTQVYYERVNSHTAGCAFNFSNCGVKDSSKPLSGLEDYPATKIRFTKGFSFANEDTHYEFEEQRNHFFRDNERRDDYMETREGMDLLNVNFKEYMIAFKDPDNLPWYVSHVIFWVASCLLLSWPLRVVIEYKTAYIHYHVQKIFGTNYANTEPPQTGQITRVNTMASSELEVNILNNFSIVPSYSEALLMDANATSSHTLHDANANVTSPVLGPTRSITWNNLSTSPSNGYITGFFSNANIPNMHHYNSCTIVNEGALVPEQETEQSIRRSIRNIFRSPWNRKRKTFGSRTENSPNTMFVLSSPESPDDYAIAVDQRLSSVRLTMNNSSAGEIRSSDAPSSSNSQIDNSQSSCSLTNTHSSMSSHNTSEPISRAETSSFRSMQAVAEINKSQKSGTTPKSSRPNTSSSAPRAGRLPPLGRLFSTSRSHGSGLSSANVPPSDNVQSTSETHIRPRLSLALNATGPVAQLPKPDHRTFRTPNSPPCYEDALRMQVAVVGSNQSSSRNVSERQTLIGTNNRPVRGYNAVMETSL